MSVCWLSCRDFILRGTVVELAVAVVLGTAFTNLISAVTSVSGHSSASSAASNSGCQCLRESARRSDHSPAGFCTQLCPAGRAVHSSCRKPQQT
jgi:hypothetical protein